MTIMRLIIRLFNCFFIIILAALLSQCTQITSSEESALHSQKNKSGLPSPYTMPASAYLAMAANQSGQEKASLQLLAAGRLVVDGQWHQALDILSQMGAVSPLLMDQKSILLAKIDLIRDNPQASIIQLSKVSDVHALSLYFQAQFHEILAQCYQAVGHVGESIHERMKLDKILPDPQSLENNRRVLWLSLVKMSPADLQTLSIEAREGSTLAGWLQLALISQQSLSAKQLLAAIKAWQEAYPLHPGRSILPKPLDSVTSSLFATPQNIALLLPMSGSLAGPGGAIRDGFMAALHEANGTESGVHVYDTEHADVKALYQQAVEEGADYIVGPLTKQDVAMLMHMKHPVPTVFLNDLNEASGFNTYQFGLSPAYEARQVAVAAHKRGLSKALVIAPMGVWGDEVVAAFKQQWQIVGGSIVDELHYQADEDLNIAVRNFLQVTHVDAMTHHVKPTKGAHPQAHPTRREDFDVVFLLAYPSKARQIMPLLKYYYVTRTPVYAISSVYAGVVNTMEDRDLDSIIFCDMPWMFTHQRGNRNWPEQLNSYQRLFALGFDAYRLSTQLNRLLLFPAMGFSDKTGVLYLNANHQITRLLTWGQFKQGVATPL